MARTPLMATVERVAAEVARENSGWRTTRAELLKRAGVAGLGAAGLSRLAPAARAVSEPSIVVVGPGLAGLSCAYRLKRAGYVAQIHEASERIGGRCWTGRGVFSQGQIYEHGGELIDQGHNAIRDLSQELGLDLDNLLSGEVNGTEPLYFFDGRLSRSPRRRTTSRMSGRRCTLTSWRRAIRRSSTTSPSAGTSSTRCRSSTGSKSPFRDESARSSASCSTSPTTSSTAPSRASRARSTSCTCSDTWGPDSSAPSASRTRSTTRGEATTRSQHEWPLRSSGTSSLDRNSSP
jgi:Flavin containing amine oxidoreductase